MSKTKVAIIGCGTIANSSHIKAYLANPDAEIKYFCDIIKEKAEKAVADYGCGIAIEDYRVILEDPEVEAVSVCTPNNGHSTISIDCLRAGKNVLCEKPAARTYEEALEMQKVQHETGKVLNIGVVNRFNTGVNIIKDMIQSGELGELYHVYVSFRAHRSIPGLGGAFTTKAIAGGGALIDWGVHFLDIVMYCSGDPKPLTVSGQAFCKLGKDMENYAYTSMWAGPPNYEGTYDVDDSVTAMIRTEGPTITLNGAWAQNIGVGEMYIDFLGDKAGIRLQYGKEFVLYSAKNGALLETTPKYTSRDMFQNEIDAFINCVRTGEKSPAHIDTVILSSKIIQGIYDSSDKRSEISFT
ncbi:MULTISPECIES: Gfo/Idh/MocA family protein [Paenibacillus]|jgi:predicted dehydrogenase|uniref:Gfo/Idh/MocA family oxidoreductase n=1 Tax=Paenibacillus oceani TaxID=2772510 RepID=A0A927CHV8_9BACL|nr:Gfo/Idh/MocA family oxidoreductase [Paenibacillus oceani]MBD2866216.1 Gfo/Idh/MocA family oxidoreductase [Paenibacillus oceani]MDF2660146.1 oxidoreductase [Paenibacillus sp.]